MVTVKFKSPLLALSAAEALRSHDSASTIATDGVYITCTDARNAFCRIIEEYDWVDIQSDTLEELQPAYQAR